MPWCCRRTSPPSLRASSSSCSPTSNASTGACPPIVGMVAQLNTDAQNAAAANTDPTPSSVPPGSTVMSWASNWAEAAGPLGSNYNWMYDDGPGSGDIDCTAEHPERRAGDTVTTSSGSTRRRSPPRTASSSWARPRRRWRRTPVDKRRHALRAHDGEPGLHLHLGPGPGGRSALSELRFSRRAGRRPGVAARGQDIRRSSARSTARSGREGAACPVPPT